MTQPLSYANIVDAVVSSAPEFAATVQEHQQYYEEVLPHVLFGDLTRFVIGQFRTARQGDMTSGDTFSRLINLLEQGVAQENDERLQNLIIVSFLENLWQAEEDYDGIKSALGSGLRRALDAIENES